MTASAGRPVSSTLTAVRQQEGKHIPRDYSYVLGEVKRIAVVVPFIIGSLIVTAVFLRWT